MVEITFTIDDEPYAVEVDPDHGHPRAVYRSGTAVARRAAEAGYEFVDGPPEYQELSRAHRTSGDPETVSLGDLTDRVRAAEAAGATVPEDGDEGGADDDETVTVSLVGPDGHGVERSFRPTQALAQVRADVAAYHETDRNRTVELFATTPPAEPLDPSRSVAEFAGDDLYWDLAER